MLSTKENAGDRTIKPIKSFDEYRHEAQRLSAIKTRRTEIRQKLADVSKEISLRLTSDKTVDVSERAAEILEGKFETETVTPGVQRLIDEREELRVELDAIGEALRRQTDRRNEVVTRLSLDACEQLAQRHKKAASRIVLAVQALEDAVAAERELHNELAEAGFDDPLPHFHLPHWKFPIQPCSAVDAVLQRATEYAK